MIHLYESNRRGSYLKRAALALLCATGLHAQVLRINCGAEQNSAGPDGTAWLSDRHFTDGQAMSVPDSVTGVYATARVGVWTDFGYDIPLPNGTYKLTLKFAELEGRGRGQRVFNVIANYAWILPGYDIVARTWHGGPVDETAEVLVQDGMLRLQFTGTTGRPIVSGIELEPIWLHNQVVATPPPPPPPPPPAPEPAPAPTSDGAVTGSGGLLVMEAENGSRVAASGQAWVVRTNQTGYSGSGYVTSETNRGVNYLSAFVGRAPEVRFTAHFAEAGTYYVWIRGLGGSFADDSVNVGLNGAPSNTALAISEFPVAQRAWGWSSHQMDRTGRAMVWVPSAGAHTVNVWMREDGFHFDKILLTTSAAYVPSGHGPAEGTSGEAASAPPSAPAPAPSAPEPVLVSTGNQFFVSPSGSSSGDGSAARPWDLATALNHPAAVRPGDTIWLRGGTYGNSLNEYKSRLSGTASAPIKVRQYPGERATINGGLGVYGPYTWFWGFEIMRNPRKDGADCIDTYDNSHGLRLINLVVHDCGSNGIGYWTKTGNSEIYGTLIYYNGFQTSARGAGHGIYLQNDDSTGGKTIADNIIFKGHNLGIQAYGSESARLKNVRMEGNIIFEPGAVQRDGNRVDAILVTVGSGSEDIVVENNYTYNKPGENDGYSRLGWQWSSREKNIIARGNYFIGGESSIELWNWNSLQFSNNVVYSMSGRICSLSHLGDQRLSSYGISGNTYYGSGTFQYNGSGRSLSGMQSLGIEQGSRFISGQPTGVWAYARPNKYEPGRGHIVVYNWNQASAVSVDVSNVLTPGRSYEIRDAQNFFGPPVTSGVYQGGAIHLPMTNTAVSRPSGTLPKAPVHTGPQFGAFVILPR